MSRNADIYSFASGRMEIGPGGIVKLGPYPNQLAVSIKLLSGGTLEIGGFSLTLSGLANTGFTVLAGSGSLLGGQTFGQMYPVGTNEVISGNVSGEMYLYASSATCQVAVNFGRSSG